jgi:Ca2+-binding RTX toxin-like protein
MIHRVRTRPRIATAGLSLLLIALPLAGIAHAAPEPQPKPTLGVSTPELLDQAVARGEIDRDTADLYLAYALSTEHERVPDRYVGAKPWDGTFPLLGLQRGLSRGRAGRHAGEIDRVLDPGRTTAANDCGSGTPATGGVNSTTTTNFYIDYGTIGGGLTIDNYKTSLQAAWNTEIDTFGWAVPPLNATPATPGGARYHVVIADLGAGLYGFVSTAGDFAGEQVNNPNTAWNEGDASTTCMALNRDYSAFPGTSQQALDATTGHEFNHSIQFGYGTLTGNDGTGNVADFVFVEGGATWMEDEAFDTANDNYNYLWPNFTRDMGTYSDGAGAQSPYEYWVVFRALTEQFGAGVAGGGEDVFQRYWEAISQNTSEDLVAMNSALVAEGTTLANAYHEAAIALRFNKTCSGGYVYPYCLEEGPGYVTAAGGAPPFQATITTVGNSFMGTVRDNYALNWVKLPTTGTYDVTLQNNATGGQLRASVACDTGSAISVNPFPDIVGGGGTQTLQDFNATNCTNGTEFAVITNQNQTAADPGSSAARSYTLSTAVPGGPTVSIANASANEGNLMTFNLSLSEPVGTPVTVEYTTANNTATAGDFTAETDSVTFAMNDTSETLDIQTTEDALAEGNETFFVNLTSVTTGNATINDGQGMGTIVDDEVLPKCPGYEADPRNQVVGTAAANTLDGTGGADIICGLGGNDTINGLGANDLLLGGDGTDIINGGLGADTLNGGDGNDGSNRNNFDDFGDTGLFGDGGNDRLIGGKGTDDLWGGAGTDRLEGGEAWDVLLGLDGNDTLLGGAGNDEVQGNAGNDTKNGGPGFDVAAFLNEAGPVTANLSTNRATGTGIGTDTLTSVEDLAGTARADTLTGNGGGNFIFGYNGNDRLVGLAGNDAMFGMNGNDSFNGGPGTDRCVQGPGSGPRTACEILSKVQGPTGRSPAGRLAPRLAIR